MNQVIYEDFCSKMDNVFVEGGSILAYLYFGEESYISLNCHLIRFEYTNRIYLETEENNTLFINLNENSTIEYDEVEDEYILTSDGVTACISIFGK